CCATTVTKTNGHDREGHGVRIGIVYARAIASLLVAHLLRAGHDVMLIAASRSTIEAINRSGVRAQTGNHEFHTPARAGRASEFTGVLDLIVIVTTCSSTAAWGRWTALSTPAPWASPSRMDWGTVSCSPIASVRPTRPAE